jgi:hypothetical protein
MAGVNFGNISTYNTDKNMGFGIALGYEYLNGGLIKLKETPYYLAKAKTSAFEPVAEFSVRFWSKMNKAKEISLLAGWGSKNASELDYSDNFYPPMAHRMAVFISGYFGPPI